MIKCKFPSKENTMNTVALDPIIYEFNTQEEADSYDSENRRVQTNITSNGNTNAVSYIYAGS